MTPKSNTKLFAEFPEVTKQQWLEKVTADLKGADFEKRLVWRTNEGFSVQPMYMAEDVAGKTSMAKPGEFPYVRGTKCSNDWLVNQVVYVSSPQEANAKALSILERGVESITFKIESDQINAKDLKTLLANICPEKVDLKFSCCVRQAVTLVSLLADLYKERKVDVEQAKGAILFDPFGRMLRRGFTLDVLTDLSIELLNVAKSLPRYRLFTVDGALLSNSGSYITQELGFALSWGNEWMARLTESGFSADEVAKRIQFVLGIGSNYFMEMAKFRAGRMLWANIVSQYQPKCDCSSKMKTHAVTSQFNMTVYDAYVNLLRTQTETMSAALAGVDSICVMPFDTPFATPNDFSERIARNQQLLLKEESHFNKVADPAAGSYYVETLTQSIAEQAWKLFLEIEEMGGFMVAVEKGFIQESVSKSAQQRLAAVAARKEVLLGTNQFPNINEKAADKAEKKTCACGCGGHKAEPSIPTLKPVRGAEQFEELRLAVEKSGKQPKVFMLTIGNLAMRLARSQFSGNFFGCAGYKIIDNLGFETVASGIDAALKQGADIVCLCSSDDEYAQFAPEALNILDGKAILVVAGAPACMDDLKAQGVKHFINVRSNVLETLKQFNAELSI